MSGQQNLIKIELFSIHINENLQININSKTIGEKTQIVPYTKCKRNPKLTLIFEPKSRQMNPVGTQMNPN